MFEFESELAFDHDERDGYMKHHVRIPSSVADALVGSGAKRFAGTIARQPFRRSLHQNSAGEACLKFGSSWVKDAGLTVGDRVRVEMGPDPNPDRVDIPEELDELLAEHPKLRILWDDLTPGRKRTLVYPIDRAKRPDTRRRRAELVIAELRREAPY